MRTLWLAFALLALATPSVAQTVLAPGLYCVQPCPTSTPPPTAAPTSTPTATPTTPAGVPYGPTSPWNRKISANPTIASYSAAVIAQQFGSSNTQPVRNQEAGIWDYGHPVYQAVATDPLVKLVCNQYCSPGYPTTALIPAKARPAGGSDAHMAVIQPDGTEIDMWALYGVPGRDWQTGDTATAGNVVNCGSYKTGTGMATAIGSTAGEACAAAGIITGTDILAGVINHALFIALQCAVGTQYPTPPSAVTDQCTSGVGPALGGRLWYDVPDATTNASTALKPWEKVVLVALHDYGAYLMDDVAGGPSVSGMLFLAQSGEQTWAYGQPNPFAGLTAAPNGWQTLTISGSFEPRLVGADPWTPAGVNFAAHMHWLAPCSAQGTC